MLALALAFFLGLNAGATPAAAIQQTVAPYGYVYSGDCADATRANVGQYCSSEVGAHGPVHAYLVGRAFSEFSAWVFVQQVGDEWVPLGAWSYDETNIIPWP
jgi:hypothetical protein